ncbi:MAG: small ribosomal subunit Rsm22 family protein [Deltaproteobacteria bacterium]
MIWVVPLELEQAVLAAARGVLGDAPLAAAALHRAVVDRSERYTSEREHLARPKDRVADLAARAAFFTIADAIKIQIPLAELRGRAALPATRPLRVVDVGAGCGALGLGLAATGLTFSYTALDRDNEALAIAAKALRAFAPTIEVATTACDVTKQPLPAADLIVMGTILNELPPDKRLPLVERALAAIADDGAVIILEPALRDTTRALHELRDALLERGAAHVFAPCTRRGTPCPALSDPDDWCHEDRLVKLPPHTAELARVTHLRDGNLKFSYLVLRKQPTPLVEQGGAAWRVVSAPHAPKGKLELLGCSDAGRVQLRLMKRHRNDQTKSIERARRGNVLVIDGVAGEERLEITGEMHVTTIEPSALHEPAG